MAHCFAFGVWEDGDLSNFFFFTQNSLVDGSPGESSNVTLEMELLEESIEWRFGAVVVNIGTPLANSSNFSSGFGDSEGSAGSED